MLCIIKLIKKNVLRRVIKTVVCIFLTMLLCYNGKEKFEIDILDVGQGDGIFLTDGHGGHIWIDGGSSSEAAVGTYRMLPFLKYHRVNAVDVWIVTHPDADHISGLEELLEQGYAVSGKAADVDRYKQGRPVIAEESFGGLKAAYFWGEKSPNTLPEGLELSKMDLQKLFVRLTGEEGEV